MLPLVQRETPCLPRGFCDLACCYFFIMLPTILLTLLQPLWPPLFLHVVGMPLLPFDVCPGYSSAWMLFSNICITNSCLLPNFISSVTFVGTTYLNQLPICSYPTFFPVALITSCRNLEFTSAVYCCLLVDCDSIKEGIFCQFTPPHISKYLDLFATMDYIPPGSSVHGFSYQEYWSG